MKYDVITFDYRGFGDSTGEPTEIGLMKDARFIYDWLNKLSNGQRKIYLWGHSLGSAIACQLGARLSDDQSMILRHSLPFCLESSLFKRQISRWNHHGSAFSQHPSSSINPLVFLSTYSIEIPFPQTKKK